jgi:hypothetical protein
VSFYIFEVIKNACGKTIIIEQNLFEKQHFFPSKHCVSFETFETLQKFRMDFSNFTVNETIDILVILTLFEVALTVIYFGIYLCVI